MIEEAKEIAKLLRSNGEGCKCNAWNSGECACNAVWGESYTKEGADTIDALVAEVERLTKVDVEPVAYMYPDDYERMTTTETFCTVYSVPCGSPTGKTTVELVPASALAALQQQLADCEYAFKFANEEMLKRGELLAQAQAENERLREALEYFMEAVESSAHLDAHRGFMVGAFGKARKALEKTK